MLSTYALARRREEDLFNNAIVTWKPETKAPSCSLEAIGTFDALVTLRFVLIPDKDLAFELDQNYLSFSRPKCYDDPRLHHPPWRPSTTRRSQYNLARQLLIISPAAAACITPRINGYQHSEAYDTPSIVFTNSI